MAVFVVTMIVALRISVIGQSERIAVIALGKFKELLEPGLKLKISGNETRWLRVRLGQLGKYVGDGIAEFDGTAIPIRYETKPETSVKIERFRENEVWVIPCKVIVVRCERCGHHNEVPA